MAKTKPAIPLIVENTDQADGALAELSAILAKIKIIESKQQDAIMRSYIEGLEDTILCYENSQYKN